MKKFFSLIAAVLFAGSMMADPIVINASDVTTIASGATSGLDVTLQGINIVWEGAYYNSDGGDGGSASVDFRVYANKSMTLTAESNISKVEIAGYCKAGLTVTANAGTITTGASYASETTKGTLEDPLIVVDEIGATSVTLTCTKQIRAYTIRVTLEEGGDVEPIELVKAFLLLPTLNQPGDDNIEMAGSFVEGTMNMLKLETGYFVNDEFVNAKADDIFKLRDKTNTDIVLCKYNARKEIWEQAIFTFGDYWSEDSYKGTPCMWIEKELNDDAVYAWLEGMPEPEPEEEVVLNLTDGQIVVATGDEGTFAELDLFNFATDEEGYIYGDGEWLTMYLLPETDEFSGVYTAENMFGDLYSVAGEDTLNVDIVEANITIELSDIDEEKHEANLNASGWFIAENDVRYNFEANFDIYYEVYEEPSEGVANVAAEAKAIKRIEMGNVVIEKNGVKYSVNGQILK